MPTETLVSQSWEMVYFDSELTEGSTDFEVLPVEKRAEFLHHYAEKTKSWFKDPLLESFVVSQAEISEALAGLKEPPSPTVRKRLNLKTWQCAERPERKTPRPFPPFPSSTKTECNRNPSLEGA